MKKKCNELEIKKCDTFSKLSAKLKTIQREHKKLLELKTISENARLKFQFKHFQEENSKLDTRILL